MRAGASKSLSRMGADAKPAVPALITALEDKETAVRIRAYLALLKLEADARLAVPVLISGLKHEDAQVRRDAATCLGRIGNAQKLYVVRSTIPGTMARRCCVMKLRTVGI